MTEPVDRKDGIEGSADLRDAAEKARVVLLQINNPDEYIEGAINDLNIALAGRALRSNPEQLEALAREAAEKIIERWIIALKRAGESHNDAYIRTVNEVATIILEAFKDQEEK